ncbi:DEAD/DEAH box helicase, partial [archaeon]
KLDSAIASSGVDDKELGKLERRSIFSPQSFADIGVTSPPLLATLQSQFRIHSPTKIQELAIPLLSKGRSCVMSAQTGSGKTLAYLLPLLERIDPNNQRVSCRSALSLVFKSLVISVYAGV